MWEKIAYAAGFGVVVGSFMVHGLALGASFDCTHATSPREKLICGDPVLSDLDGRLGRVYQERRALLSPRGAELLLSSQRSWLHFITIGCPLWPADADQWFPKNCLQKQYEERLNQLAKVGQRLGPFVFNRIDRYAAKDETAEPAAGTGTGEMPGFSVRHVAYPQIDNLHSPQVGAWNKTMSNNGDWPPVVYNGISPGYCEEYADCDIDYEIGYANKRMISLQWSGYAYSHGMAHGSFAVTGQNIVLLPSLRPLTQHDVFGADDRWVVKLQELFWDPFAESGLENRVKAEIEDIVIRPSRWLFTTEGLEVSFNSGEGGCEACTPQPVTVPWAKLKPLLSRDAVVP